MTRSTLHRSVAAAAALALAATLGACGTAERTAEDVAVDVDSPGGVPDDGPDGRGDTDGGAAFVAQDVEFAQMMIIHHDGALEMAELAVERAETEEVRALAERIRAAQDPEIQLMESWLEQWGEDREPAGHAGHGYEHDDSMMMDGMDHDEAMEHLREQEGREFDRRFLELMIDHHRGAVVMSEQQLERGTNPAARELAEQIIADQEAEIAEMEQMLDEL
jgi:uncharacterized protein (DUF305 family)